MKWIVGKYMSAAVTMSVFAVALGAASSDKPTAGGNVGGAEHKDCGAPYDPPPCPECPPDRPGPGDDFGTAIK